MENVTCHLTPVPSPNADVVALQSRRADHFDPTPLVRLAADLAPHVVDEVICEMLEGLAGCLERLRELLAQGEIDSMHRPAGRLSALARDLGMIEVGRASHHVRDCLLQHNLVALDATMARLERGFDVAVSEVWSFREV